MAHGSSQRIVRIGFTGDTTVVEYGVQIQVAPPVLGINFWRQAGFDHMHVAHGVGVEGAVRQVTLNTSPFASIHDIRSVKWDVLADNGSVSQFLCPLHKLRYEFGLAHFTLITGLFFRKAIHLKRARHNMRPLPHAAFSVESPFRPVEINRSERKNRVFDGIGSSRFDIEDYHIEIILHELAFHRARWL